jgi:hypothetical protein
MVYYISSTRPLNINGYVEDITKNMERLAELLFILASFDRLTLLSEIGVEKRRLSQLTTTLSATHKI